jgi:hypothetical protein
MAPRWARSDFGQGNIHDKKSGVFRLLMHLD